MNTQKTYSIILSIGIVGSFIMSIMYLFKSYSSLHFDDTNFVFNISILYSNITSMVILIFLMRRTFLKNKKQSSVLFSKQILLGLLLYFTLPLEIIVYNLYTFGIQNYIFEKLTSLVFGIACLMITVYMVTGKDLNNKYL